MTLEIRHNEILAPWTWWKVGGSADHFCLPRTSDEVVQALSWAQSQSLPWTVLGGGSNVLISDRGISGLVICLRELTGVSEQILDGRLQVVAAAGSGKSEVLKFFLKHKLAPALFLSGLPGDVGGGIYMNAGVGEVIEPREFNEIVDWFEVVKAIDLEAADEDLNAHSSISKNFEIVRYKKDQIQWSYRHSTGWQPGVIVRAQLSWPMSPDSEMMQKVKQVTKQRFAKQPLNFPSCGSVFKNPSGYKSGALIEQSGLKGFTIGGAQVSEKHANFIINKGGATAADINHVIEHVRSLVAAKFGVRLETEVKYLGRW